VPDMRGRSPRERARWRRRDMALRFYLVRGARRH
jgi:hypothetical protein